MKANRILFSIVIAVMTAALTSCGNVKIPKSSAEYAGMNYQEVSKEFDKLGFENISSEAIADLPSMGEVKDGAIEAVTINGESFEENSSFPKDAAVMITYHTIKTIPFPIGPDEISNMEYKDIEKLIVDNGFTNVTVNEIYDMDPDTAKVDHINEVLISGSADFAKGDEVPFDAEININCHRPYQKFDVKVHVNFLPNLIFNKYPVEFYIDDENVKNLDHGEDWDGELKLKEGTHKFLFEKAGSSSTEGEEDVEITSNSEVEITIECESDYIVVKIENIFRESDVGENQVRIPWSAYDLFNEDHNDVVDQLKAVGFTNITEQPLYDITLGITEEGAADYILINGSSDFEKGEIFDKDVEIIVPYHMNEEKDPNKEVEDLEDGENGATGESVEAIEENADEASEDTSQQSPNEETTYYSTNSYEVAKLGISGKFAYIKRLSNYHIYYIIDFDEGYVYRFLYGQGDQSGELYTIDSGDLNNGLYVTYHSSDGASDFTQVMYFHYVNNPAVMIENLQGIETKFEATSIDDALKIKDTLEFPQ